MPSTQTRTQAADKPQPTNKPPAATPREVAVAKLAKTGRSKLAAVQFVKQLTDEQAEALSSLEGVPAIDGYLSQLADERREKRQASAKQSID